MTEDRNKEIVKEVVQLELKAEEKKREIEVLKKLKQESPRKKFN